MAQRFYLIAFKDAQQNCYLLTRTPTQAKDIMRRQEAGAVKIDAFFTHHESSVKSVFKAIDKTLDDSKLSLQQLYPTITIYLEALQGINLSNSRMALHKVPDVANLTLAFKQAAMQVSTENNNQGLAALNPTDLNDASWQENWQGENYYSR